MFFAVISIFPAMFQAITDYGITARALQQKKAQLIFINPRDFTTDNYRRVDERPYGGGPGMVMMAEPLAKAVAEAKKQAVRAGCEIDANHCPVVYLSPQGQQLNEQQVVSYTQLQGLILICGRYEGIDERIITTLVDAEISIGDYVLTGGELPAMVLIDSLLRRLPDVMTDNQSAEQDSFVTGLLDYPQYTKPLVFNGEKVPDVLLSGHHGNIAQWRLCQQQQRTQQRRPDLWQAFVKQQRIK